MTWSESKESLNHSRGTSEAQLLGSLPSSEVVSAVRDWCSHYVTSVCLVHPGSVYWECKYSYSEGVRVHVQRKKKPLEPHEGLFWRQMRLWWYCLFLSLPSIWYTLCISGVFIIKTSFFIKDYWDPAVDLTVCNSHHTDRAETTLFSNCWGS